MHGAGVDFIDGPPPYIFFKSLKAMSRAGSCLKPTLGGILFFVWNRLTPVDFTGKMGQKALNTGRTISDTET